jgi:sulfide:quinone oxidoreductase
MADKRILIIGGGFGGVAAALAARQSLGRQHRVTLVDRSARTYLCGSYPLLMVGERHTRTLTRSLNPLRKHGVEFLQSEVTAIDLEGKTVTLSDGKRPFDYLVLAPGAEYDWDAVPGAASAHSFYDLEMARRLRTRLRSFRKGRVVVAVARMPYKCPPAPFEAAFILDWYFRRSGVRKAIEIHVFTPEPAVLPIAGPEAGAALTRDLGERGIELHTNAGITAVRGDREAVFGDNMTLDADLVITIPVHRVPNIVEATGLTATGGWVPVKADTLETRVPGVYAIGDVNVVEMANGRGLPKAGVFASSQGETVGHNIAAAVNGDEPVKFPGIGGCFLMYGTSEGAMLQGEFLTAGKPSVTFQPPSANGGRAKERFERDWRSFQV